MRCCEANAYIALAARAKRGSGCKTDVRFIDHAQGKGGTVFLAHDLEEQIEKCNSISKYFSVSELRKLENISQNKFDYLFTITSAIEEFD